jgi:hypothetical protein
MRAPGEQTESRHEIGGFPDGFDPREGIRRINASFPIPASAIEWMTREQPMQPSWTGAGISPGSRDTEARIGGGSIGVIERLLREQNDLIRQDTQRNMSPPIAAPPPMRGGGIRM